MRKHLCGLAVILLVCAALFALPAFAADVARNESTGTLYDTLDAALEESNDGDTITLLDDAETADPEGEGSYTYVPLTIEMNGHGITGKLTVTDDLKLEGGWFYGLLVVDISGEEGALTITAPDTAKYAVNQMLTVNDGTVNISGAKIAVRGTLSVSGGTAVTLSGTEKAVELFGAETFGNKFYGAVDAGGDTDTAAVYNAEQQTYTVGGVAAKKLSNINAGEPDPAEKPKPNPGKTTVPVTAGSSASFKVAYTGTEDLVAQVQKNALDDTIRVSAGKTGNNMWTVTVTLADEPKQTSYLLHIYPAGDTSRSATVTVNVVPHKAKVVEGDQTTYFDDLSCTLTADDGTMQITLLDDIEFGAYSDPLTLRGGSPITLDLGGHSIDYVCIGEDIYDENYGTIGYNSAHVTVVGDGSIEELYHVVGTVRVRGGTINHLSCSSSYEQEGMYHGNVFLSGGTLNGNLSVSTGSYNVTVEGGTGHKALIFCDALETKITDGEFEELILVPPTSSDCTLVLSGGKFGKIKTQSGTNEKGLYLAKYLAPDYFFYTKPAGGSDYTQLVDASAVTELTDVVIKKHTHTVGADGKCTECGTHVADIRVEKDGTTTYLAADKLQDAINMMQTSDSLANTVTLLSDIDLGNGRITITSGSFTLDLGGKTLSSGFVGTWHALLEIKPDYGVYTNVHIQNGSIVNRIHDSSVYSETIALLLSNNAAVTLSDVTVSGGTNQSGKNPAVTQTFGTLVVEGDSVLDGGLFADKPYAITLRGGSFTAGYQSYGMLTAIKVTTPGDFGYYRDAVDFLAEGYAFVKANDETAFVTNLGNITEDVKIIPHTHDFSAGDTCACGVSYVAELNGVKYTSLNKAIAAANGGTVKLLCDVDFGASGTLYAADAAYTLDLAGHTLRGNADTLMAVVNSEDGTAAVSILGGFVVGSNSYATIRAIGADLTLHTDVTNTKPYDYVPSAAIIASNRVDSGSRITIVDGTYIGGVHCYSKDSTVRIMRGVFERGGNLFSLKASYYDIDQRKEVDLPLAAFIAPGSYVVKTADDTKADLTNLSVIEDAVTVKVCTAHDFGLSMDTNGVESVACKNCGKRCTHTAPGADGKCTECGFTLEAQVGDAYYAYFSSAVKAAAEAGGTVKLLCNVTTSGPRNIAALPSGTYTLDLAGHKLSVGTDAENPGAFNCGENTVLTVISSDGAGILNAGLYIHGDFKIADNLSVEGLINIYKSLEVDSTSYAAPTFNGEVTVKDGAALTVRHGNFRKNVTVESGGRLNAFERDGGDARFTFPVKINAGGKFRVTGSSSFQNLEIAAGADVLLEGGRFNGYIYTSDNSPLAPYLADGYAFENFVTGVIQDSGANSLTTVTVVGHTAHNTVDADTGKCACGKQMLAVRIARDNSVIAGYDDLQSALGEAQFGDTVRLFGSAVGGFTLHPQSTQSQITLDLNGKQVDGGLTLENVKLTVENGTLSAGSALTVASDASLTLTDVKCGWDVTVSGKLAVTDADTVCTGTVTVQDGGSAELSGGSYKKIVCETGTVADCLEDAFGYTETANAESWLNGDGKTIADTTVLRIPLVLVHIGNTSVPYGTDGMLTVLYDTIDISPDRSKVSFQWYTISGDTYTPIADETDDMYVLRAGTVPGKYHVACAVTYKGYTMRADGLIGIRKATLTEGTHYTAPTAASLVYDGNAHALLAAGSIAANADLAGCKFVYSDSKDGNYTETMPTATAAGNYTVWYMVKGNNCFEDSAKGSLTVHIAIATVTAANKDYPTSFTYGTTIPAPTKANLTVTGDYDDATLTYAWRDAAGNTLAETPTELGSYTLHIEIAATANTGAAVVDIPISIEPHTALKVITQGVEVYNGNSPRSYEVDLLALAKAGGYVPDGDTLTVRDQFDIFFFTDDGSYSAYDPATADYAVTAVQKDGKPTTLVITVSGLNREVYSEFCAINAKLSDAHYTNILAQLSLIAIDKEEKTLSVTMDGWTYGLYDGAFNKPVYMVPAGTEKTTVTYYAEDGSALNSVPTDAGNYSVRVVCETGDAIWSGSADFAIARRDIADASVTLGDALTYDTTEQTQTVRAVHFDGVDVSYTVETGSDKATNAGNYTLRLIGTGNYTGTLEVPFTVSAKVVTATVVVKGNYTYAGGNAILPTVKVTDGNVEIDPSEYTVACANNIHAGTATVRIVNADGGNYVVSGETTFSIGKAAQNLAANAVTGVYGESGKTVSATGTVGAITYAVTAGSEVLDVNESGALTFKQGGDATVRISAAGDNDHAAAFIDVNVHVDKAHVTLRALDKQIRTGNRIPALDAPVLGTDYTVEGLLGSDSLTGKVTLRYDGTPNASRAGEYAILIEHDGTDPRYTADAAAGKLTVKRSTDGKAEKSYKISVRASEGGSVSPYGTILALEGKDQTLTFIPDDGYRVSALYIDGSRVSAAESYTFKRVNSTHTVEVVFAKIGEIAATDFDDVPDDVYYKDAVDWAVDRGITVGASAMKFDPNGICTRAQAVTFLWRALGKPAAKNTAMSFTDVAADAYYADAVLWAVENKIVLGVSETKFDPDGICTRAQIVTLLWRAAESPTADSANPFTDVAADAYYADAVFWAVGKEITIGTSGTTFSPNRICTRAEIVTFLYRTLAK